MPTPSPFSPSALRAEVDKYLAEIPAHHGAARLKVSYPDGRVEFVGAARVNDHWMLQGSVNWKIGSAKDAKVEVLSSWAW